MKARGLRSDVVDAIKRCGPMKWHQISAEVGFCGDPQILDCLLRGLERGSVLQRGFDGRWYLRKRRSAVAVPAATDTASVARMTSVGVAMDRVSAQRKQSRGGECTGIEMLEDKLAFLDRLAGAFAEIGDDLRLIRADLVRCGRCHG